MAQTVANLTDVLKEAWTSERLEKQFYDENPFLDRIEKQQASMIGEKAIVPIHKGRSGGYTSTNAAGGSLNAADEQKVDSAEYTLIYHWFQVELETGALNQSVGGNTSAVVAKDLEIQGAIADMRKQCMRQVVSNGDGFIAACDSGGASTTVELLATGYGYDAIVRGWLHPGLKVDIGTTADSDAIVAGSEIVSVSESASDPDIVISDSVTTTTSHFVSIANPNSGTATNPELNGLRQIAGSTTAAVGGLDPDTAGEEFWKPASVDTSTTTFSLDLALDLQRATHQKTGRAASYILTSLKQQANFYSLLQNQVRFTGETKLGAGKVGGLTWNGMEINAVPDVPDREWYVLNLDDFRIVTGSITKPTWASDLEGSGGRLRWGQGTTSFKDGVVYPWQLAITRRNGLAAAIGLTG